METHILLLERTPLADLLQYLKMASPPRVILDRSAVIDEWRNAERRTRELQSTETGLADDPPVEPLSSFDAADAEAQLQDPGIQRALSLAPHHWCTVNVDRLVVYQKVINRTFVEKIQSAFGNPLSAQDLIQIAVGARQPRPAVEVRQTGDSSFSITCPSGDIRALSAAVLDPASISGCHASGCSVAAVAVFVGFALNCINALRVRRRLVLINGMHRVYALRERGVTHMPCLVQDVVYDDELDIIGAADVRQRVQRYLGLPRPPLFKDYFDERLTKVVDTQISHTMLQVHVSSQRITIPLISG